MTEPLFVADAYALLSLGESIPPEGVSKTFDILTRLVEDGQLIFPKEVYKELHVYVPDSTVQVWCRAVAERAAKDTPDYKRQMEVLKRCPGLIDADAGDEWQPQIAVAAMALDFHYACPPGPPVHVVTEDTAATLGRQSLSDACAMLGIACVSASTFIDSVLQN